MNRKWIALMLAAMLLTLPCLAGAEKFSPADAAQGRSQALALLESCAFQGHLTDQGRGMLIRWTGPIRVFAEGAPGKTDLRQLDRFLMQLAFRVPELPPVTRVETAEEANVVIHYLKLSEIKEQAPDYVEGNWGYQVYTYHSNGEIFHAEIWVARDKTGQSARCHLMLKGLVSVLGLTNMHRSYTDSVLCENWSTLESLSEVDWLMLNMLYSAHVFPGWTWEQARDALTALYQLGGGTEEP
jgi:hypothetical protein